VILELFAWSLICIGAVIVAAALLHVDEPQITEPPWSAPEPSISTILKRLNEEETADNHDLTLHESTVA
jgi:hypothetical protein